MRLGERAGKNSVRKTRVRGRVGNNGLLASKRTNVSFISNGNGIRGRAGKSGLLASERTNVSSVRNGNGIRGRVKSGRGWARGREFSVRKTRVRGRVGKSG